MASGILGLSLSATIATRWFEKKRGLVIGILTSGFAAGQLTFVPLTAWLTTVIDWRYAAFPVIIGSLMCATSFLLFGKDWPIELSLKPYGSKKTILSTIKCRFKSYPDKFFKANGCYFSSRFLAIGYNLLYMWSHL